MKCLAARESPNALRHPCSLHIFDLFFMPAPQLLTIGHLSVNIK
jgi:hypothetical protein